MPSRAAPCIKRLAMMAAQSAQRQGGGWVNPLASFECGAESAVSMDGPNRYLVRRGLDGGIVPLQRSDATDAGDLLYSFYHQELSSLCSDLDNCFTKEELSNLHMLAGLTERDTRSW